MRARVMSMKSAHAQPPKHFNICEISIPPLRHQTHQPRSARPKSPRASKRNILLILVVAATTLIVSTTVSILLQRTIHTNLPSLGTIRTLGVEADLEQIDWGTLWLGSASNATVTLTSISNIPTTLNLTIVDLRFYNTNQTLTKPPATISDHMNLTWNYNGSLINPGDSIQVTLILSAEYSTDFVHYLIENDIKRFSLDILISTDNHTI